MRFINIEITLMNWQLGLSPFFWRFYALRGSRAYRVRFGPFLFERSGLPFSEQGAQDELDRLWGPS